MATASWDVLDVEILPPPTPTWDVLSLSASGALPVYATWDVLALSGSGKQALYTRGDEFAEPFDPVTVEAFTQESSFYTNFTWRQVSGPPVSLVPNSESCTFTAPTSLNVADVVLGVTASNGAVQTVEATATVQVPPHLIWLAGATEWSPVEASVL